jgi:hypothetical protein
LHFFNTPPALKNKNKFYLLGTGNRQNILVFKVIPASDELDNYLKRVNIDFGI